MGKTERTGAQGRGRQELPSAAYPPRGFPQAPSDNRDASLPAEMRLALHAPSMHSLAKEDPETDGARTHFSTKSSSWPRHTSTVPGAHTGSRGPASAPTSGCPAPNPSPRSCSPAANPPHHPLLGSPRKTYPESSDTGCEHREAAAWDTGAWSDLGFCGTSASLLTPLGTVSHL